MTFLLLILWSIEGGGGPPLWTISLGCIAQSFIFQDNFAEVSVTDPTQGNTAIGYLYLFDAGVSNTLNPDAGEKLVNYNFNLVNGDYLDTYKFTCDAWVTSVEGTVYTLEH